MATVFRGAFLAPLFALLLLVAAAAHATPGNVTFYLISGNSGASESSLGQDSAGNERLNTNSCP